MLFAGAFIVMFNIDGGCSTTPPHGPRDEDNDGEVVVADTGPVDKMLLMLSLDDT